MNHPSHNRSASQKHVRSATATGLVAACAIVAVLTGALYFRAALSAGHAPRPALPVATAQFALQESYQRTVSYLGLVVAGRKADLGFEIPGKIVTPPPRPGTAVQQNDILVQLDDTALQARRDATASDLQQARVELELAQLKARRQADLIKTGAVSKDAYDETRLRALALEARVDADTARLATLDIELEKSRLLAPYDGIVADRYVQEGAIVNPGVPVLKLLETTGQESHIGVSAERLADLRPGSAYTLKLRDNTFEATLLSVRPDVDPLTRTATAVFANPPGITALDGEAVMLQLQESVHESGGWIPIAALLEGRRGIWTVLRLEPEGEDMRTVGEAVEVLEVNGDRAYVRGTLPSGTSIVASGTHRLSPGALVSAQDLN
ncbi:MAG: efflux RND transporter periplasmic adaptor subunit [Halioglobus sp.]|nr:efflux RND transporter periplasmic adaptor subunit [Halioglobus sp.]